MVVKSAPRPKFTIYDYVTKLTIFRVFHLKNKIYNYCNLPLQLQIFGQSLQISFVQKRTVIAASVARVGFLFLRPKSTLKLTTFNIQESILGDLVKLQFCD